MLVGIITREPPITMDEWKASASHRAELVVPPLKTFKNPFTGEPVTRGATDGTYNVAGDGFRGAVAPSAEFDRDGTLELYSPTEPPDERLVALIERIAAELHARTTWFEPIEV